MGMRFGHELDNDFCYPGDMWSARRVRMIVACRAAGIDGPFGAFRNDKACLRQATCAASLGAVGRWCIHPNVDLYNESMTKGAGPGRRQGHAATTSRSTSGQADALDQSFPNLLQEPGPGLGYMAYVA